MTVQHGDECLQTSRTKARLKSFDSLWREGNLRYQNNRALALLQRMRNGLEIDFGLAAAGDAVEEEGAGRCGRWKIWGDGGSKGRKGRGGFILPVGGVHRRGDRGQGLGLLRIAGQWA